MPPVPDHLLARLVRSALVEDLGPGDLTTRAVVPAGARAHATIAGAAPMVVAGMKAARLAFSILDPAAVFSHAAPDGSSLSGPGTLLVVEGDAGAILSAERTALNFLGRLSGIATLTRRCVEAVAGTGAVVLDTRKTTPGLRPLEKEAVLVGGGRNHRFGLYDAVLIKDNHLVLAGGPGAAVRQARALYGATVPIEVEVEDLAGLDEALAAGADIVLLDNMPVPMVAEAVERRRRSGARAELEVSGGITLQNIAAYARAGVSRISLGALTHSAPAADVGLSLRALP